MTADVNGDGLADVIQGPNHSVGDVWLGRPDGSLQRLPLAMPSIQEWTWDLLAVDFDGDGDRDLAVITVASTSGPAKLRLLHNNGSGAFVAGMQYGLVAAPSSVLAAGDLDADGDQDLVVGQGRTVFVNDGTGSFQAGTSALSNPLLFDSTNAVTLADLDGDGDTDAYISNVFQGPSLRDRVFRNDGQGVFTEVAPPSATLGITTLGTIAHDFDLDGDVDLVQRTSTSVVGGSTYGWRLLRNDGGFVFVPVWAQSLAPGARIDVAQWDGDGRADLAVHTGTSLLPYVQTTPLQFAPAILPALAVVLPILLDVDQDLDTDCIAASSDGYTEHRLVRNVGSGWSQAPAPPTLPPSLRGWTDMTDLNGDGKLDMVCGPTSVAPGAILLGDGSGAFSPAPGGDLGPYLGSISDIACGDVDGDGDPDVLMGARQEPVPGPTSRLFRNVGGTLLTAPFPSVYGQFVHLHDLDGDADLDAVLVDYGTIHVATNDGTGAFQLVPGSVPVNQLDPRFVHLADFDGDGDADLLVEYGNSTAVTQLFRNVGGAVFQAQAASLPLGLECAADLDADGDVDLLGTLPTSGAMLFYRNVGSGAFQTLSFPSLPGFSQSRTAWIVPEDLDQDGRVDLVVIDSQRVAPSWVLHNQGGLVFVPIPIADDPHWGSPMGFFDFDHDGDRDLMLQYLTPTFLRSIHRHLAPARMPRVGSAFELDLRGRASEAYLLGFAPSRTWLPIPGIGSLQLDPAALYVAAAGSFDSAGQGMFAAAVPNAPSLAGLVLHWQVLNGPVLQLGNLLTTELQAR